MTSISKTSRLKFEILSKGIQLSDKTRSILSKISKAPQSMRFGLSSGIELIFPDDTWVNAPVNEHFVKNSPLTLDMQDEKIVVKKGNDILTYAETLPKPTFYDKNTADGTQMKEIGSIRADRLSISISRSCVFWANRDLRCKFCAIGHNQESSTVMRTLSQVLETVEAALNDPIRPCKHLYLTEGALPGQDRGMHLYSTYIKGIKEHFDKRALLEVYTQSEEMAREHGVPLGPLCIPCQMHSLTIPENNKDYFYF